MRRAVKTGYLLVVVFILATNSGTSQVSSHKNMTSFHEEYYRQYDEFNLLLSCMVYSKMVRRELSVNARDTFLAIGGAFHSYINSSKNTDSIIDEFVKHDKSIDYTSDSSYVFLRLFIENYKLVTDVIYANIGSNLDFKEIKSVQEKILRVPGLSSIYRQYMYKNRDMGDLDSNEGTALDAQMAYFLCLQTKAKRNEIIKSLL